MFERYGRMARNQEGGAPPGGASGNPDSTENDTPNAGGHTGGGADGGRTFSQAEVDRIIKDRLEREKGKTEAAAQKAKEEAEAAALAKNQEFEALAAKRAEQLAALESEKGTVATQLEAVTGERDRYKTAVEAHLATQREGLPPHIIALLDRLDPVDQLEYIAANREHLGAAGANGKGAHVPATPKADDGKALTEQQKKDVGAATAAAYRRQF
jgi:hypothetical protein